MHVSLAKVDRTFQIALHFCDKLEQVGWLLNSLKFISKANG